MAFSINKAYLVGNVTKDPEVKYTPNNNAVCTFNLATNRSVKKGDDFEDVATFHRVVVWGKIGEWIGNNVSKGDPVVVEGRIENRSFEQDGITKYISEIIADNVIPFARKSNNGGSNRNTGKNDDLVKAAEDVFGTPPAAKKVATRKPAVTNHGEDIITDPEDDGEATPF